MIRHHKVPFQVAYFYSGDTLHQLREYAATCKPDVVFCHLIRMSEYARKIPAAVKVLDYMDAFSKGMERLQSNSPWWIKIPAGLESRRLLKYENEIFEHFNYHIIISKQDRAHIPHPGRENIDIIPNGVDFSYFQPQSSEKKFDLLFNGHMSYPPNIASAQYAAKEIFPRLKEIYPEASMLIAGADPVKKVLELEGKGITVKGWVDDIRTVYSDSRILLAPMLISIGLQNKILQAMAMKIPCVISEMANNALGAEHGKHLFVAGHPEEYCRYIHILLTDAGRYREIAEAGYAFIKAHFTWEENTAGITKRIYSFLNRDPINP